MIDHILTFFGLKSPQMDVAAQIAEHERMIAQIRESATRTNTQGWEPVEVEKHNKLIEELVRLRQAEIKRLQNR